MTTTSSRPPVPENLLPTRRSLVEKLGDPDDRQSWQRFFDTYAGLLYRVARRAGLSEVEAQEAVQETVISVARNVGQLRSDPARGSFKGWLLQTARWRVVDQFRRRAPGMVPGGPPADDRDGSRRTDLIERVPDPGALRGFESAWEEEWRAAALAAAWREVRRQVDPAHAQIFDCCVHKG